MRLLYYYWGEITASNAQQAMRFCNIEYKVISPKREKFDFDYDFINSVKKEIANTDNRNRYDALFSFNFYPDLSRVAVECGIKYISWVYDSPHSMLESVTLTNDTNRVFIFDYALYMHYKNMGINTVYYCPLPSKITECNTECKYTHEITFIGNLYDGEQDFYGQITYLPPFITGYLDALIKSQQQIYGFDIIDNLVDDALYTEINKYVKTDLGVNYRDSGKEIFKNMLRKRVTRNERIEILLRLGDSLKDVDLYCGKPHPELPVNYCGYANYDSEMSNIFRETKINLNISLKSIQTGIPLRIMDILGAGGFCITNYQSELPEYFENGTDIVWYESIEDLENKCRYYLAHDEEREEIAQNGHRKAIELFAYDKLLTHLLEIAFE